MDERSILTPLVKQMLTYCLVAAGLVFFVVFGFVAISNASNQEQITGTNEFRQPGAKGLSPLADMPQHTNAGFTFVAQAREPSSRKPAAIYIPASSNDPVSQENAVLDEVTNKTKDKSKEIPASEKDIYKALKASR